MLQLVRVGVKTFEHSELKFKLKFTFVYVKYLPVNSTVGYHLDAQLVEGDDTSHVPH